MIALGAFVASFTQDRWELWLANGVLIGLFGKAAMIAPLVANATRWFDKRRGLAVAIIASGQGLAGVLWPPIFQGMNDLVGWRETFFYFSIFSLITMLPLAWLIRPHPPAVQKDHLNENVNNDGLVLGLSSIRVQMVLWIAVICCCSAMAMPVVHLVSYGTDLGPVSYTHLTLPTNREV